MNLRHILLLLVIALNFIIIGAGLWETVNVVPVLTEAPPASFKILQEPYGLHYVHFWIIMHSVFEVLFLITVALYWKNRPMRNKLGLVFLLHMLVRISTFTYFAPVMLEVFDTPAADVIEPELYATMKQWQFFNYMRMGAEFALSFILFSIIIKYFTTLKSTENESVTS